MIDRKFKILAVNESNGKVYTDENAVLLCAKDAAVPAALKAYEEACRALGCDDGHLTSIRLLRGRVGVFQADMDGGKGRVPDTVGEELDRCLGGEIVNVIEGVDVEVTVVSEDPRSPSAIFTESAAKMLKKFLEEPDKKPLDTYKLFIEQILAAASEQERDIEDARRGTAEEGYGLCEGMKVKVYDRYRFAIPLAGEIVRTDGGVHGSVEVELHQSNHIEYPVGCKIWVHAKQCERES